jgi:hypothetical protein
LSNTQPKATLLHTGFWESTKLMGLKEKEFLTSALAMESLVADVCFSEQIM